LPYPLLSGLLPAACRDRQLDFTLGDLNRGLVAYKSGIFSDHSINVEKVFISLELFMLNCSSKKLVIEITLLNCSVFFPRKIYRFLSKNVLFPQ
jgi:hypothetical protein